MKNANVVFAAGVLFCVIASGCNSAKKDVPAPASQAQPSAPAAQADGALSGKVVETMNSGGYTYARLTGNGGDTWIAAPAMLTVKVGDPLVATISMPMEKFRKFAPLPLVSRQRVRRRGIRGLW